MFEGLKRALRDLMPEAAEPGEAHSRNVAIAALLVEVSRADRTMAAEELALIESVIRRHFASSGAAGRELLARAQQAAADAVSTFQFTRVLNDSLGPAEKVWVIERLWEIAWADGAVEKYEEALVRKVADLLYVPHADMVAARWRVAPPTRQ
jgi:uncharacterized tellurite resistance protein B-like protein